MCDMLNCILDRMCKIVHRINTPLVSCIVMRHMCHTVNDRVSHIDIRRCHINLCAQHLLSILEFSVFHCLEQLQVFLNGAFSVRTVLSRLCQCPSVLSDLFRSQVTHICLSFFDQFYCAFVHLLKIIGCKVKMILPVSPQPLDIFFDRIHKLHFFFGRVGIVKTHMESSIVFFCQSVIQKNGLGMSDVQIPVRLWRETGAHMIVNAFCKVFVYFLFNEIF